MKILLLVVLIAISFAARLKTRGPPPPPCSKYTKGSPKDDYCNKCIHDGIDGWHAENGDGIPPQEVQKDIADFCISETDSASLAKQTPPPPCDQHYPKGSSQQKACNDCAYDHRDQFTNKKDA